MFWASFVVVKGPFCYTQHSSPTCAHCIPEEVTPRKMGEGATGAIAISNRCVSGGLWLEDIDDLEFHGDSWEVLPAVNKYFDSLIVHISAAPAHGWR